MFKTTYRVLQHINPVILPEKLAKEIPTFICRLGRVMCFGEELKAIEDKFHSKILKTL